MAYGDNTASRKLIGAEPIAPTGDLPTAAAKVAGTAQPLPGTNTAPGTAASRLAGVPATGTQVAAAPTAPQAVPNLQAQIDQRVASIGARSAATQANAASGGTISLSDPAATQALEAQQRATSQTPYQRAAGKVETALSGQHNLAEATANAPESAYARLRAGGAAPATVSVPTTAAAAPVAPAPAVAPVAAAAPPPQPGLLSRALNSNAAKLLGRTAGTVARGAGYFSAATQGAEAVNELGAGQYANAARSGLSGALDLAATRAPSPVTIGGALIAHGLNAAADRIGPEAIGGTINQVVGGPNDDAQLKDNARARLLADPNTSPAVLKMLGGAQAPAAAAPGAQPGAPPLTAPHALATDSPGAANAANWTHAAQAALASNNPGTAVINGRVVAPAEIKALENRNVISSENFTHPGIGIGRNLSSADALAMRGNAANEGGGQLIPRTSYTGGIGAPVDPRQKQFNDTLAQVKDLVGHGKRRSARIVAEALNTLAGREAAQENTETQRNFPRPQTSAEEQLAMAQAGRLQQQGQLEGTEAAQRQNIVNLQTQLADENDPAKRKALENKLAAASGKAAPDARDRLVNATIPIGTGVNATHATIPFDPNNLDSLYEYLAKYGTAPPAKKK